MLILTNINMFMLADMKSKLIFVPNNTCHASHLNSAPGRVFAFYRLSVSNPLNNIGYAIQ